MSLNLPRLTSPRFFAVHPVTGRPIAFGSITFYAAGTTTLRTVYADRTGLVPAQNPTPLDAAGSCEVFLSGPYRIEVKDTDGSILYEADRLNSIPVESSADNPGSLMAANNLSDLIDSSAAREALGLARQGNPSDMTADRLLAVGAFGLGAYAPGIAATAGSANDVTRATGWVSVAPEQAETVGAPGNAHGILHTVRDQTNINQTYYPLAGGNPSPWRRVYAGGAWTPWVRDAESGVNLLHRWTRHAGGLQHCWHTAAAFIYVSTTSLRFVWNFPKPFAVDPVITATLPSDSASLTGGLGITWLGSIRAEMVNPSQANVYITRQYGTPDFAPAHVVNNVKLLAVGEWTP